MGLTVLDAGVVIGLLNAEDAHHQGARAALAEAVARGDRLVLPASALAECLVSPSRRGPEAVATVLALLERLPVQIASADDAIAVRAAALRARHRGLKLPDALVVATAVELAADRLITTDRRWPRRTAMGLAGVLVVI